MKHLHIGITKRTLDETAILTLNHHDHEDLVLRRPLFGPDRLRRF